MRAQSRYIIPCETAYVEDLPSWVYTRKKERLPRLCMGTARVGVVRQLCAGSRLVVALDRFVLGALVGLVALGQGLSIALAQFVGHALITERAKRRRSTLLSLNWLARLFAACGAKRMPRVAPTATPASGRRRIPPPTCLLSHVPTPPTILIGLRASYLARFTRAEQLADAIEQHV